MDQKTPPQDTNAALWGIGATLVLTFTIWMAAPLLKDIVFLEDQGASWYFWQLPERTAMGVFSAWFFYGLHQITMWGLIFYAQRAKPTYGHKLHNFNWYALGLNGFFCVLHIIQTQLWYDGLAQHVSIWSAQVSVVVMLIWVLLMETPRRGLFFGKKVPFSKKLIYAAKKYHGYYFSWAIIYTFWYHPTEATFGHLMGFSYIFVLLLQGSLFFTQFHVNRKWTLFLEMWVIVHGTLVALESDNNMWGMFFFGFSGIFIITQMHGLNFTKLHKWGFTLLYLVGATLVAIKQGPMFYTVLPRIAVIDFIGVFILAGILWVVARIVPSQDTENSDHDAMSK